MPASPASAPSVLDGVTAAPGTTPKRTPRPATPKLVTPAKPKAAKAPAKPSQPPAPKPERTGLPVLPDRRKLTAADATAPFVIAEAVDSPWEAGAQRLVTGISRKIGTEIDLAHAKTSKWLGRYKIIKPAEGTKYSVWAVAQAASR